MPTFWPYKIKSLLNVFLLTIFSAFSGSTGKPKGVVHSTAGYMIYAATTFQLVFAHKSKDVYFCTADVGWITGHTYGVYGPLLQGATSVMVNILHCFVKLKIVFSCIRICITFHF